MLDDDSPSSSPDLAAARAGSQEAIGLALESCRRYLQLIAQQSLSPKVATKEAASDMVQATFLEAHRDFAQFQGSTEEELRAWLRRILLNTILNAIRGYRETQKRDADREVSLNDQPSGQLAADSARQPTPSRQVMAREQFEQLNRAIDRLPEDYRLVIRLRNQDDLPFDEIATRLARSENAVRKLWFRAIQELQTLLDQNDA